MKLMVATNTQEQVTVAVSPVVFGRDFNEPLVHQVVVAYMAAGRVNSSKQKTRAEVRGGGRKPWRQKGTGRARAGSIRSPLWRGGGVTFASKSPNYVEKINKKMYRRAMQSILSELARQQRARIAQDIFPAEPKTKLLKDKLDSLGLRDVLIVVDKWDDNLYLSSRNLPNVTMRCVSEIDPVSLLRHENVLFTEESVRYLEEAFV